MSPTAVGARHTGRAAVHPTSPRLRAGRARLSTLVALLALAGPAWAQPGGPTPAAPTPPAAPASIWTAGELPTGLGPDSPVTFGAFSTLAEQAAPSVVSIETEATADLGPFMPRLGMPLRQGAGSGVVIHRDGYVLSNNHVVANASRIKVHLHDGRVFDGEVLGTDPATDIALLKIAPSGAPLTAAPFGDSDVVKIGEWVVAIGNPMGLSHTVTAGIVSAKGRKEVRPGRELRYADFIQTDASINPGNSGGPLFNLRGQVVGINTAINAAAQGIGFAIPINMIKTVLPQLADGGRVERSWLGVGIQPVDPEMARSFGLENTQGALIASVVDGGPAEQSGVEAGDVIRRFDGQPVKTHDDLPWLASNAGIGRVVEVEVVREGKPRTLKVTLGRMPGQDEVPARFDRRRGPAAVRAGSLGMEFERAEVRGGRQAGRALGGVRVSGVDPGSKAARKGVRPGDLVRRCNGSAVSEPAQLARLLDEVPAGGIVRLLLQRDDSQVFIAFEK